jgi:hypothetical protein
LIELKELLFVAVHLFEALEEELTGQFQILILLELTHLLRAAC